MRQKTSPAWEQKEGMAGGWGDTIGGAYWSQIREGLEGHIQEFSCVVLVAFSCVVFVTRINMIRIVF